MVAPRFDEIEGEEIPSASRPATAPRFDEIEGAEIAPDMGADRAAALGFAQGGTMGFVDEIGGLVGKLTGASDPGVKLGPAAMSSASDTPDERAAKEALQQGVHEYKDSYTDVRDRIRNEAKQAREQHGAAFTAGDIAGGVLANTALGMAAPAAAAPLVEGMSGAVTQGALSGIGQSEADSLGGMYRDAAVGAGLGAAGQYVGQKAGQKLANSRIGQWIGEKAGAIPDRIRQFAQERAVKAATGQNRRAISKMVENGLMDADVGTLERVGQDLLDRGVVTAGASQEEILKRAAAEAKSSGSLINRALHVLDSVTPKGSMLSAGALADEAEQALVVPGIAGSLGQRDIAARMAKEINALRDLGDEVPLSALEDFKRGLDDSINYAVTEKNPAQKALAQLRGLINEAIETKADDVAAATGSNANHLYREAKAITGSMITARNAAKNNVSAGISNRLVSPSDYGTGIGGALVASLASGGSLPIAAVAGTGVAGVNHALRTRGNQVASAAASRLANSDFVQALANSNPQALGKYGGMVGQAIARGEFPAFHWVMQQRDPEYRATIEAARKGDTE